MKRYGKQAVQHFDVILRHLRKTTKAIKNSTSQSKLHYATKKYLKRYDGGSVLSTYIHNRYHIDYSPKMKRYYYDKSQSPLKLKDAKHIVMMGNRYQKHATSNHRWEARSKKNHDSQRRSRIQSYAKLFLTHPQNTIDVDWAQKQINNREQKLENK